MISKAHTKSHTWDDAAKVATVQDDAFTERGRTNDAQDRNVTRLCKTDLPGKFEDWLDQQVLPPDIAEHANFVLAYLQMDQPLPACLRAALAEHVEALKGRL